MTVMQKLNPSSLPHKQRAFTLIEIMVVVVILGILAAIVVPRLMSRPDEAKIVKVKQDVNALESALELYKLDNGIFPSTNQGLKALVVKPTTSPVPRNWKAGGYIKSLPEDPWGQPYNYVQPGVHNPHSFDIFSYGANGSPGGTGVDAEVGNWTELNETSLNQ